MVSSGNPPGKAEAVDIDKPTPGAAYSVVAYYYQDLGSVGYHANASLVIEDDAAYNTDNVPEIVFGPTTWADLERLGGEPMIEVDRRKNAGRVVVDYPFSTTMQTSVYARSNDFGDTFRTLFDPNCL